MTVRRVHARDGSTAGLGLGLHHHVWRGLAPLAAVILFSLTVAAKGRSDEAPEQHAATHDAGRVTLTPDATAHAGIATVRVAAASAARQLEAFGRVLDPLALVEALHARAAARASAAVARSEYERVQRLHHDDQNASTRDLEAARAALARANLELANASARVALAWGAVDVSDALADDLVGGRAALARIDLAAGEHLESVPPTVTVAAIGWPERRLVARVLGRAPTVDPALQGEAYLALITDSPPSPGAALVATLERPEAPSVGVSVPAAAVLWLQGRPLVYAKVSPGTYERRAITLGAPLDGAWVVTEGVVVGEEVVTSGAAQLLSAEILGAAPAEE